MADITPEQQAAIRELAKRRLRHRHIDYLDGLFDKQLDFIKDPSKRKAALCTRRAGKTWACRAYIMQEADKYPGSDVLYATMTRRRAKDLMWNPLVELNRTLKLGASFNKNDLQCTLKNGSVITLAGLNDERQAEKFLGGKYRLVVIDEAASIPDFLRRLVLEVLSPALEDLGGTLAMIGTPGAIPAGYFHEITTSDGHCGFGMHQWSVADNPFFQQWAGRPDWREYAQAFVKGIPGRYRISATDPEYLRQWFAQWIQSDSDLLYSIDVNKLIPSTDLKAVMADKNTNYILGMDLGWHDSTAFVVAGYNNRRGKCYEIYNYQKNNLVVDDIASMAMHLIEKYDPEAVVIDGAGEGKIVIKSLAESITQRYGIPVEAAEKDQKAAFIRLLDSDFRVGKVCLLSDSDLWRQLKRLQWNDKFTREADGLPCDLHDAFLYAYRRCMHWDALDPEARQPLPGEPGYDDYIQEKLLKADDERYGQEDWMSYF